MMIFGSLPFNSEWKKKSFNLMSGKCFLLIFLCGNVGGGNSFSSFSTSRKKFVQAGYLHYSHYNILHYKEYVPILHFHPIMFSQSCKKKKNQIGKELDQFCSCAGILCAFLLFLICALQKNMDHYSLLQPHVASIK